MWPETGARYQLHPHCVRKLVVMEAVFLTSERAWNFHWLFVCFLIISLKTCSQRQKSFVWRTTYLLQGALQARVVRWSQCLRLDNNLKATFWIERKSVKTYREKSKLITTPTLQQIHHYMNQIAFYRNLKHVFVRHDKRPIELGRVTRFLEMRRLGIVEDLLNLPNDF